MGRAIIRRGRTIFLCTAILVLAGCGAEDPEPVEAKPDVADSEDHPEAEAGEEAIVDVGRPWRLAAGTSGRTNFYDTSAPSAWQIRFTTDLPAQIWDRLLVRDDGYLFGGDLEGHLVVVSTADGSIHDRFDYGTNSLSIVGTSADSIVGSAGDTAFLITRGEVRWTFPSVVPHVVADGKVFGVAGVIGDGMLYALDVADGYELWQFNVGGRSTTDIVYDDGVIVIGDSDGRLLGIDAATGRRMWQVHTVHNFGVILNRGFASLGSQPVIADGTVYSATADDRVVALDLHTGQIRWEVEQKDPPRYSLAVADGHVLYNTSVNLVSRSTKDGSVRWTTPLHGRSDHIVVAGHTVIVASLVEVPTRHQYAYDTVIAGFKLEGGAPIGETRVQGGLHNLTVYNGVIYGTVLYSERSDVVGVSRLVAVE